MGLLLKRINQHLKEGGRGGGGAYYKDLTRATRGERGGLESKQIP